jgi:hypothetical protein
MMTFRAPQSRHTQYLTRVPSRRVCVPPLHTTRVDRHARQWRIVITVTYDLIVNHMDKPRRRTCYRGLSATRRARHFFGFEVFNTFNRPSKFFANTSSP